MFYELLVIVDLEIAAAVSTFQCITVFLLYYVSKKDKRLEVKCSF